MDIKLARTFLAVVDTGSFVNAAERVHVTQSTVSMRIKSLEEQLGRTLFERNKNGAVMTPAGAQFQRHALAMVRVWEQARLEVSLPEGFRTALTVGGQISLCDGLLLEWLALMRRRAPDIAITLQFGFSNVLMQRLIEGTLDLGVMYTPQSRPGFAVDMLFEEEIILVSSEPTPGKRPGKNYVYVDWGPEFQADHSLNFPELSMSGVFLEIGSLGLKYLLENSASGYFPRRLVGEHLESGRLKVIRDTPVFSYPAYVVYPLDSDPDVSKLVLRNLKKVAANQF
jgi:DNA-binding transcriptional LysR family regulator